tara:strand:- start:22 stop:612 length:591 start_codon:yes stop_codon:yes gene_type:complete
MQNTFSNIFTKDLWQSNRKHKESKSGAGSFLKNTKNVRNDLPDLLNKYDIKSMLDIPCGDMNWISKLNLNVDYVGADIVPELIAENQRNYPDKNFKVLDVVNDPLPEMDLILCRDCFVHLPLEYIKLAIDNIRKSGIKYMLVTSFPVEFNKNISIGKWRPLNMCIEPFNLQPIEIIDENEKYKRQYQKHMLLVKLF